MPTRTLKPSDPEAKFFEDLRKANQIKPPPLKDRKKDTAKPKESATSAED